jgi:hypothetical protein
VPALNPPVSPHTRLIPAHTHTRDDDSLGSRGMLAAKHALVVPMLLRLSHFRLSYYVVLVVSKQKGITLFFKTDPLQNVCMTDASTFRTVSHPKRRRRPQPEARYRRLVSGQLSLDF